MTDEELRRLGYMQMLEYQDQLKALEKAGHGVRAISVLAVLAKAGWSVVRTELLDRLKAAEANQRTPVTEWRAISKDDGETYGWLWSPWQNLVESLEGREHLKDGEIRFGKPRDYTWATMIIPVPEPPCPLRTKDTP